MHSLQSLHLWSQDWSQPLPNQSQPPSHDLSQDFAFPDAHSALLHEASSRP